MMLTVGSNFTSQMDAYLLDVYVRQVLLLIHICSITAVYYPTHPMLLPKLCYLWIALNEGLVCANHPFDNLLLILDRDGFVPKGEAPNVNHSACPVDISKT